MCKNCDKIAEQVASKRKELPKAPWADKAAETVKMDLGPSVHEDITSIRDGFMKLCVDNEARTITWPEKINWADEGAILSEEQWRQQYECSFINDFEYAESLGTSAKQQKEETNEEILQKIYEAASMITDAEQKRFQSIGRAHRGENKTAIQVLDANNRFSLDRIAEKYRNDVARAMALPTSLINKASISNGTSTTTGGGGTATSSGGYTYSTSPSYVYSNSLPTSNGYYYINTSDETEDKAVNKTVRKQFSNVNSKLLVNEFDEFALDFLDGPAFTVRSEPHIMSIVDMFDDYFYELKEEGKVYNYKIIADQRNNSEEDIKNRRLNLDILFRQVNCHNQTKLRYVIEED